MLDERRGMKTCTRCGETKPHDRYHFKPKGKKNKLTTVCRDCINAWHRDWHNARRRKEIEAAGPVEIPATRECSVCHEHKPLTREFFDARKDCMFGLAGQCIECRRAEQRAKWHSNPEFRARRLVAMRMDRRLRAEREGRDMSRRLDHRAVDGHEEIASHAAVQESQPLEPLALWLDEIRRIDDRDGGELEKLFGVPSRRLYGIRAREGKRVAIGTADKMLWNYGKAITLRDEAIESTLRERWQNAPGNGTRLLRYMDEAEGLAHLSGAVIERVEDLWPELAQ